MQGWDIARRTRSSTSYVLDSGFVPADASAIHKPYVLSWGVAIRPTQRLAHQHFIHYIVRANPPCRFAREAENAVLHAPRTTPYPARGYIRPHKPKPVGDSLTRRRKGNAPRLGFQKLPERVSSAKIARARAPEPRENTGLPYGGLQ